MLSTQRLMLAVLLAIRSESAKFLRVAIFWIPAGRLIVERSSPKTLSSR